MAFLRPTPVIPGATLVSVATCARAAPKPPLLLPPVLPSHKLPPRASHSDESPAPSSQRPPHRRKSNAAVRIRRARCPHDLPAVYSVWNAVAEHEGYRPLAPDECDSHDTTVHLLAHAADDDKTVIGAARFLREQHNVRLDRVAVLPDWRHRGTGRALVDKLLVIAGPVQGAIYVNASRGSEMGFFSILGFESVGNDFMEHGLVLRTMMYRVPVCTPSAGCVGLHHTSIRVADIEKSLAFYGTLGFFVTDKFLTSNGSRACYVEGLGTRLEFVEAADGKGGLTGVQGVPPAGFDRLVFDVTKACTDLESYLQHLNRKNGASVEVVGPPARQIVGTDVISVACIADPDGLPIEFFRREAQVPKDLRPRITW